MVDEGITQLNIPTIKNLTTDQITSLTNDVALTLSPGTYEINIPSGYFKDAYENITTTNTIKQFSINYVTPTFTGDLVDISNDTLAHDFDLSNNIAFLPFGINDLNIVVTSSSEYFSSMTHTGNGLFTLDLSNNVQEISILETTSVTVALNFQLIYGSQNIVYTKDLLINVVYIDPVITAPTNKLLTKQTGSTLTYTVDHVHTNYSDLSYNYNITTLFYGTIDVSFAPITSKQSELIFTYNLDQLGTKSMDKTINIIDTNFNKTTTINETITSQVPYRLTRVNQSLEIEFTQIIV